MLGAFDGAGEDVPGAGAVFELSRRATAMLKRRDCGIDVGMRMLWIRDPRGRSWEGDCFAAAEREARAMAEAIRGVAVFMASSFCEDGLLVLCLNWENVLVAVNDGVCGDIWTSDYVSHISATAFQPRDVQWSL